MRQIFYILHCFWIYIGLILSSVSIKASHELCDTHFRQIEKEYAIPHNLLRSIGVIESGRKQEGTRNVWPWTVNANGKGYYFKSKTDAIRFVEQHKSKGIKNIDIGCMQVNLHHHPKAFRSISEAFQPYANIRYAAQLLSRLKKQLGSWSKAALHYHSATPKRNKVYGTRLQKVWNQLTRDYPLSSIQTQARLTHLSKHTVKPIRTKPLSKPIHQKRQQPQSIQQHPPKNTWRMAPQSGQFFPVNTGDAKFFNVQPEHTAQFFPVS